MLMVLILANNKVNYTSHTRSDGAGRTLVLSLVNLYVIIAVRAIDLKEAAKSANVVNVGCVFHKYLIINR